MISPTDLDIEVRLGIFDALIAGKAAPSVQDLAASLGKETGQVEQSYRRLNDSRAIVLHPDSLDIWMANPFSAVPTAFTVASQGRSWYGNCIWDSLGILALLGTDGAVEASCPDCSEPLDVQVSGGAVQEQPCIVHFAVPAGHWWDDIGYT